MSPELLQLLIQIPIVGIFIWFVLEWTKRNQVGVEQRDAQWRDFLIEQRENNNRMYTRQGELETKNEILRDRVNKLENDNERLKSALLEIQSDRERTVKDRDMLIAKLNLLETERIPGLEQTIKTLQAEVARIPGLEKEIRTLREQLLGLGQKPATGPLKDKV